MSERDHVARASHAPVTLVEYGDYECPYCGAAYPIVKEIQQAAGRPAALRLPQLPAHAACTRTPSTRPRPRRPPARRASSGRCTTAVRAPGRAGRRGSAAATPTRLGLDWTRFAARCWTARAAPRVREDFLSGVRSGVNGTPTFFINGAPARRQLRSPDPHGGHTEAALHGLSTLGYRRQPPATRIVAERLVVQRIRDESGEWRDLAFAFGSLFAQAHKEPS